MIDGQRMEPLEEVVCELEDEFFRASHRRSFTAQGRGETLPNHAVSMHMCVISMSLFSYATHLCAHCRSTSFFVSVVSAHLF